MHRIALCHFVLDKLGAQIHFCTSPAEMNDSCAKTCGWCLVQTYPECAQSLKTVSFANDVIHKVLSLLPLLARHEIALKIVYFFLLLTLVLWRAWLQPSRHSKHTSCFAWQRTKQINGSRMLNKKDFEAMHQEIASYVVGNKGRAAENYTMPILPLQICVDQFAGSIFPFSAPSCDICPKLRLLFKTKISQMLHLLKLSIPIKYEKGWVGRCPGLT